VISNIKVEENARFGGHFKKNQIYRIPVVVCKNDINCVINISCFQAK
jgi:hypothetical protein